MSSSGQNDGGLMSSAGLVRYFDSSSSKAIRFDPRSVLAIALVLSLAVIALHGVM